MLLNDLVVVFKWGIGFYFCDFFDVFFFKDFLMFLFDMWCRVSRIRFKL